MEKLVGDRDLLAFVCEDSEDASRLMNSLRMDQGLRKINVVTADPNYPPNAFQTMTLRPQLRKFLVKFVSDTFEAPKIIKDFLLAKKNLHKVSV